MSIRLRTKRVVLLAAVAATALGSATLLWTPQAEAARCCKVMVCSDTACWEECRTCPKFP